MTTLFSFVRSLGRSRDPDEHVNLNRPPGFVSLDDEQLRRLKGGFDTEGDGDDDTGGGIEPDPDPYAGDPPEDDDPGDV